MCEEAMFLEFWGSLQQHPYLKHCNQPQAPWFCWALGEAEAVFKKRKKTWLGWLSKPFPINLVSKLVCERHQLQVWGAFSSLSPPLGSFLCTEPLLQPFFKNTDLDSRRWAFANITGYLHNPRWTVQNTFDCICNLTPWHQAQQLLISVHTLPPYGREYNVHAQVWMSYFFQSR